MAPSCACGSYYPCFPGTNSLKVAEDYLTESGDSVVSVVELLLAMLGLLGLVGVGFVVFVGGRQRGIPSLVRLLFSRLLLHL